LPASSFDTFFACTIIVAVVLIATAFTATTLHSQISSTEGTNKNIYLKAIADHILTNPGAPANWGTESGLPSDFGIANANSATVYEIDIDKISRLNSQNLYALSYLDIAKTSKLTNIALSVTLNQIMSIKIQETSQSTIGSETYFTFSVSTNINSRPTNADIHFYAVGDGFLRKSTAVGSDSGVVEVTIQVPTDEVDGSLLVAFARASFDDRITCFAIYNFGDSSQESTPQSFSLALSPLDYTLHFNDTNVEMDKVNVLSYSRNQTITSLQNQQCTIHELVDKSPLVIVAAGTRDSVFFQEWTTYPQIPLQTGANFEGSAQNIFSYLVNVNGVFYRLELGLGDVVY
jgi:hypothetical protein